MKSNRNNKTNNIRTYVFFTLLEESEHEELQGRHNIL